MSTEKTRAAFVVATKDRPREFGRLIQGLEAQTRLPDEIIVVDGGRNSVEAFCRTVRAFPVRHIPCLPPSASRQRNRGVDAVHPGADLIGFLDDDVVLDDSAMENMLQFWQDADGRVGGASFNMLNHPPVAWPWVKLSPFAESAGLYSRRPGTVSPAGFQTMIGRPWSTVYTDWLPSTASLWRREVFDHFRFDEWFEGYSYLEDLDFSYRVGKAYSLAVVADAGYFHFPAGGTATSSAGAKS
jgi:glycosyltransferase involved in cell wall biosynthesis